MIFAIVCWSFGFAAMGVAFAATLSAGDLIKASGAAVYYYGDDGKRYVFPTESTYMSWYGDFSAVKTITDAELAAISIGGNATVRPGTKLVKIDTDPKTYAVSTGGVLQHVDSETRAVTLYGADWASRIIDIPESFWVNYSAGDAVSSDVHPDGALVKYTGASTVYLIEGGLKRAITGDAFTANRFKDADITTIADTLTYSDGSGVIAKEDSANVDGGASTTPTAGTGLTVALASDTPGSAIIVDRSFAEFAKYSFTASSDGAVTIQSIKITRQGVGSASDISSVYLYEGINRLTSSKSISSSDNIAEFNNINYEIPEGSTKVLSIWGMGADGVSGNHALKIAAASDIVADGAAINGSFPVSGNTMSYSAQTEGNVTLQAGSSASNPTLGDQGVIVEKFSIQANTEKATIYRIMMKQVGTADMAYLDNFEMYQANTKVADGIKDGKYVSFEFNSPYTIDDGLTKHFDIKCDIGAKVTPTNTISLDVYESVDVYAVGGTFGYGLRVIDSKGVGDAVTVQGGDVTFADNGPVASDIKDGGNDVVLLNFAITSVSDITIKDLDLAVLANSYTALNLLDDIRIKNVSTGATLSGPHDATHASLAYVKIDFSDDFEVNAGETLSLAVTADVHSDAVSGNWFELDVATAAGDSNGATCVAPVIEDSEGNSVTTMVPSTHIIGERMTVATPLLKTALAATPASTDAVKGATDVEALGIIFTAGGADDVNISSITLLATALVGEAEDVIGAVALYDQSDVLLTGGVKKSLTAATGKTASVQFDGLDIDIAAGDSYKVIAKIDVSGSLAATDAVKLDLVGSATLDTTSNVTATDSEGSTVTVYDEDGATTGSADWDSTDITLNDTAPATSTDASDVEIDLLTSGTLTITANADTPAADVMVAATTGNIMSKFDFTSQYESFNVEKLTFSTTAGANFGSLEISYPTETGTRTQTGYFANDVVTFTGMTMYVSKDATAVLTTKGNLNSVTTGATAGNTIDIDLRLNSTDTFRVTSGSGVDENPASGGSVTGHSNLTGSDHRIFRTKPTIAFVGPASATLTDGTKTLLEFSITADAGYDVKLYGVNSNMILTDNATTSNLQITNVELYDKSDMSTALTDVIQIDNASTTGTLTVGSGTSASETVDVQLVKTDDGSASVLVDTIPAGQTVTYVIQGTVSGSAQYDSIIARLSDDAGAEAESGSAHLIKTTSAANEDDNYAIIWNDGSITSTLRINSNYLDVIPTSYSSISR